MVLLSYFLHRIPKDSFLLLLWWSWGACRGEGWLRKHEWVWGNVRDSLWTCAISQVCPGSSDLQRPSAISCQWPGSVESPHDLSHGKAFSHSIFVEVSCIQAWRGGSWPLFMLRSRLVIAASEAFCSAQSCLDNKMLRWGHKSSYHFKSPCNYFKYWKYYLKKCLCAVVSQEWNNSTFYLRPWKYFPPSSKIDTTFPPLALKVGKMLRRS